jgi:hypothetical protein
LGGRSAGHCIRLFQKSDPNPQCWTSHFSYYKKVFYWPPNPKHYGEPYIGATGVPYGILRVFNTILYENEFQNPQIFYQLQPVRFSPKRSSIDN